MSKFVTCVALASFLAGCASASASRSEGTGYEMEEERNGPTPPPDPNRVISEQDCTMPIEMDGGNLRCR
ncbi:MAG TPA: hypothetical protein VK572_06580 [Burkholderiales bacterium]|nr:hypothetical protein [Burkholderiales bacterium]